MDTRSKTTLNEVRSIIKLAELDKIINNSRKQEKNNIFTTDVIRKYSGHFIKNSNTPAAHSFNANFGKYLKENSDALGIKEVNSGVTVRDDNGGKTKSSEWMIL